MSYFRQVFVLTFASFISTVALSQTFFNPGGVKASAPSTQPATKLPKASPNKVVPASQFQSNVNTMSQQTTNALSQKASQKMTRPLAPMTTPTLAPGKSTPAVSPPPSSGTSMPQTMPTQPQATPTINPSSPSTQPNSVNPLPPSPATTPANNPSPYTGFGTGTKDSGNPSSSPSKNQSGGWQIQY